MFAKDNNHKLAALADGELRDAQQLAQLQAELSQDPGLRTQLETQREVKAALGSLPQYAAPDFMATRVMGEIAARRSAPAQRRWRPVVAWLGGAAALLVGFGTAVGLWPQAMQSGTMLAESQPAPLIPAGLTRDMQYSPQYWQTVAMPEGVNDSRIKDFLQFASAAHHYRQLQHASNRTAPDMAQTMLALDQSPTAPVVWATDSRPAASTSSESR